MQEPHEKGIANHLDPESYADAGNHVGEALTGAHAGQPWSSESTSPGVPILYGEREGHFVLGFQRRDEAERGAGKPETFDFPGFTHCCGKTRQGAFTIKRVSVAKRMRAKLQTIKEQLKHAMHRPVAEAGQWLRSVVQGWFHYHAVPGNRHRLDQFRPQVARLWLHVLRRRSQKSGRWTWDRMKRLIDRWLPRPQTLHPFPNQRLIVTDPR